MAEQEKRSPTEKPVLLSKDIEAKLSFLDREVTYLLNKAKFAKPKPKPKPKDKNSTSTENGTTNSTDSEKVIPPKDESSKKDNWLFVRPCSGVLNSWFFCCFYLL